MLKTAIVAMTIVGCDCNARLCEFISETPAQWTSIADCEAAMKVLVVREKTLNYPLVSGVCRTAPDVNIEPPTEAQPANPPMIAAAPDLVVPEQDDAPSWSAIIRAGDMKTRLYDDLRNGRQLVFRKTTNGYSLLQNGFEQVKDFVKRPTLPLLARN